MEEKKIPVEKLQLAKRDGRIHDKKLETKPVGYFRDAFRRFCKNKSSAQQKQTPRDPSCPEAPKSTLFSWLGWDGCSTRTETQAGYDYYQSIAVETGESPIKKVISKNVDESTGRVTYKLKVASYDQVGFVYADLSEEQYQNLQQYSSLSLTL